MSHNAKHTETDDANSSLRTASVDDDSAPESIDTDIAVSLHEIEQTDDVPLVVDVALRAVTIRRVDLERNPDESLADWIRRAVQSELEDIVGRGAFSFTGGIEEYCALDGSQHESSEGDIVAAVSSADSGDWIGVPVAFPTTGLELIERVTVDDQTVCDWIRTALSGRFTKIDSDLDREYTPVIEVEVPEEIAFRASLNAEYSAVVKGYDYDDALLDALNDIAAPLPVYTVGGNAIARFDTNGDD